MKSGEKIEIYEGGNFYRNYSHVNDIVDGINIVMNFGNTNEIYNVGNSENYKFIDLIYYAASKLNYDTNLIQFVNQKDFHKKVQAKSFMLDTGKLQGLGFVPQYGMEAIVNSIL